MAKVFYNLIKLSRWVLERVPADWYEEVKALLDADAQAEADRLAEEERKRLEEEALAQQEQNNPDEVPSEGTEGEIIE